MFVFCVKPGSLCAAYAQPTPFCVASGPSTGQHPDDPMEVSLVLPLSQSSRPGILRADSDPLTGYRKILPKTAGLEKNAFLASS